MATIAPKNLADKKMKLAIEYEKLGNRLIEVKTQKAYKVMEYIALGDNNARAESRWDNTELGIEEMTLKIKMKGIEKLISAVSTELDVMNREAQNYY